MKKILVKILLPLTVIWNALNAFAFAYGLPSFLQEFWEVHMAELSLVALTAFVLMLLMSTYVFWPSLMKFFGSKHKETESIGDTIMGDNYDNSGNNFGHMGPVNISGAKFVLTDKIMGDAAKKLDKTKPVAVAGTHSGSSKRMVRQMVSYLGDAGFVATSGIQIGTHSGIDTENPVTTYPNGLPLMSKVQTIFIDPSLA